MCRYEGGESGVPLREIHMNRLGCALLSLGISLLLVANVVRGEPEKGKDHRLELEIRLAEKEPAEGLDEMVVPKDGGKIYVHPHAALTNADVAEARAAKNRRGQPSIKIVFAGTSRKKVGKFSEGNIGKLAAIFIDGKLVGAPKILVKFSDTAEITGDFTQEEVERIVKGLNTAKQ
jgi:preprotein translocase subunit SecD